VVVVWPFWIDLPRIEGYSLAYTRTATGWRRRRTARDGVPEVAGAIARLVALAITSPTTAYRVRTARRPVMLQLVGSGDVQTERMAVWI
jgi:hypothetical protein